MTDKINKLKYEPGDKVDTSDRMSACPNGHTVQIRSNVPAGQGRIYCPVCGWSDKQQFVGSTPIEGQKPPEQGSPFSRATQGVKVISQRGVEARKKPNIVGR